MTINAKILNKILASLNQKYLKRIITMTDWDLYLECMDQHTKVNQFSIPH